MDIDIDRIDFQLNWPIIGRLKDELYPYEGYDHIRYTARGLIENSRGQFVFLHIAGEDLFGVRDHLETCGGGLEENEALDDALIREVREELGHEVHGIELVGSIVDTYNLIHRITLSTFFHAYIDEKEGLMHRTEEEEILIREIVCLDPLVALDRLEHQAIHDVDKLVQRRDALALRYYLKCKGLL
jgi:8-oxo-dGTP pyrophosphatase MutT (NUDIX family)